MTILWKLGVTGLTEMQKIKATQIMNDTAKKLIFFE